MILTPIIVKFCEMIHSLWATSLNSVAHKLRVILNNFFVLLNKCRKRKSRLGGQRNGF